MKIVVRFEKKRKSKLGKRVELGWLQFYIG